MDSIWGGGGAETSLLRLIHSLPPELYQCHVLTFYSEGLVDSFLARFPCPVYHWPMISLRHPSTLALSWKIFRLVRHHKIDIVHTFFPASDLWAGPLAKLSGARGLISSRRDMGILRKRWHGPLYRLFRNVYDEVHAVSEEVRRYTIATDGTNPARTRTVYNGVDAGFSAVSPACNGQHRPVVAVVANVRPVKGIDVFLQAAALVHQRFPQALFRVAGAFGTNPEGTAYQLELLELQRTLALQDHVQFLGAQSDILIVLKATDIFVLPSRSEGFSNALLEAMACGLPCVATRVGGNPELVVDGESGFLVPPEDPGALAEQIMALLADEPRRRSVGHQARQRVVSNFTSAVMSASVKASYQRILARKFPGPRLPA